ncbi:unnamed protein product [Miscanthus lutarioriparius]|uniref:PGG domain-containing protein n=1 Tax=Miscanthus lutarioriparius TaxID=422564 RepID=A0A811S1V6_9POAL|nr:unnamed protein product [Miscanthus lutarioriparius]
MSSHVLGIIVEREREREQRDGEIIQETTAAGAEAEAAGGKDKPSVADNEEQAAAHRSKEEEEEARKKKEEAEAALMVFLEIWLRHWKEDVARKKKEEEEDARKKLEDARKKEDARASDKNCLERYRDHQFEKIKKDREDWEVKKDALDKMREWLMLLATLAVSIAYSAGLNPPGGLWQDDGGGRAAGTPVLQSTNRSRYLTFYYSNAMSFVTSLVIIALLFNRKASVQALVFTTMFDLMSLVVAYIAGTTSDLLSSIGLITIASAGFIYFAKGWELDLLHLNPSIQSSRHIPPAGRILILLLFALQDPEINVDRRPRHCG